MPLIPSTPSNYSLNYRWLIDIPATSYATEQNPKFYLIFSFLGVFMLRKKFRYEKINIWAKFENLDIPLAQKFQKVNILKCFQSDKKRKCQFRQWQSSDIAEMSQQRLPNGVTKKKSGVLRAPILSLSCLYILRQSFFWGFESKRRKSTYFQDFRLEFWVFL